MFCVKPSRIQMTMWNKQIVAVAVFVCRSEFAFMPLLLWHLGCGSLSRVFLWTDTAFFHVITAMVVLVDWIRSLF